MTENSVIKKEVLKHLKSNFEDLGFKLKGDNLFRETETGLYQIIGLGLGPVTSIKANNIGLDFGITTEEWLNNLNNWKRPKVLTSSDCEIRDINCKLIDISDKTIWHPISVGLDELKISIEKQIAEDILPLLNRLQNRDSIISMWRLHKNKIGIAKERHQLAIGVLMILNKDVEEGKSILNNLRLEKTGNTYFEKVLLKVLNKK